MPDLAAAKSINSAFAMTGYRPTALFVGGTSGIGEGTAGAFARATKGNAHILICGRNKANAERIIATFPKAPNSQYDFVECDATLMKNVVKAAADIRSRVGGRINYIVLSQGIMSTKGFNPTEEGIDTKLALHFYSRWKFVDELMPCLEKAAAEGQEARVMSIGGAGTGAALDTSDLGLKKTFSLMRAARQVPTYGDIFVEEYAARHPTMSFIHAMPGFVDTPLINSAPIYMRALMPVLRVFSTLIEDCGEWMSSALTNPDLKNRAWHVNRNADLIPKNRIHADEASRKALVEHFTQEMAPFET